MLPDSVTEDFHWFFVNYAGQILDLKSGTKSKISI